MSGAPKRTAPDRRMGALIAGLAAAAIAAVAATVATASQPAEAAVRPRPVVPSWEAVSTPRVVVYLVPGTAAPGEALAAAARVDRILDIMAREAGLELAGPLAYPLYPSTDRFRQDWWRFATLGGGYVHGWGSVLEQGRARVYTYQVTRAAAQTAAGRSVPLLLWGLGDYLGDRLLGADSHLHARLFLDRGGLPAVGEVVHQIDFSRALPGAYAQGVSFVAFLAERWSLPQVVELGRAVGERWYEFEAAFERYFGVTLAEADLLWRERLAPVPVPALSDSEFGDYLRAVEFSYSFSLARSPGGLVMRQGGATAYLEALRAVEAVRTLDLSAARQAALAGRQAMEAVRGGTARTRRTLEVALWALGIGPVVIAVVVLAVPSLIRALIGHMERRARRRRH